MSSAPDFTEIILTTAGGDTARSRFPAGTLLADALRAMGVPLDYACGGRGVCGKCRVRIRVDAGAGEEVLSCQRRISGEMLQVEIPESDSGSAIAMPDGCTAVESSYSAQDDFGLAVDLGTTTIQCALVSLATGAVCGLRGVRNPQTSYGRDVISRISSVLRDPASAEAQRRLATRAVGGLAGALASDAGIDPVRIREISVSGNTTMEYLFAGIGVEPLGSAPFSTPVRVFRDYSGREFDWGGTDLSGARLGFFPIFSAFVGGDVLSGYAHLLSQGEFQRGRRVMLLDAGTNGEVLFSDGAGLYATSTAAGPAFEGGEISCGTLAVRGAISSVRYSAESGGWRAETIGGASAVGACGSGLVDALAGSLDFGLISRRGRIAAPGSEGVTGRISEASGERRILISNMPESVSPVYFTQHDVRQAQLALGAMKCGRRALALVSGDGTERYDAVHLAGGFGCSLNISSARRIGLLPDSGAAPVVKYAGNASLLGAIGVLTERIDRATLPELAEGVRCVDLASREDFAELFAGALGFD